MKKLVLSFIAVLFASLLHAQSFEDVKEKAEQGDASAQYSLGHMYLMGKEIQKDDDQALYWYMKSAEQGNPYGQFGLGTLYILRFDEEKAFYWYKKSAEQDFHFGQYHVGAMYYNGNGTERDYEKAIYWLTKSSENGNEEATHLIERVNNEIESLKTREIHEDVRNGETLIDIDGNTYKTVIIGEQVWMAENLRTTTYNDGTPIPYVESKVEWDSLATGAYCWYNNNAEGYADGPCGALYNWYTLETEKVCPAGWHVSTDDEWRSIFSLEKDSLFFKLFDWKDWLEWKSWKEQAKNQTGFSALPCGYRNSDGFTGYGSSTNWWTPTRAWGDQSGCFGISSNQINILYPKRTMLAGVCKRNSGYSIRCVKD